MCNIIVMYNRIQSEPRTLNFIMRCSICIDYVLCIKDY